ncbi:hypothetical protein CLAFUW4_06083 [Fulvia fulva]|uniref:Uncharacterized protein n=1 Tax=Passalora fulva TaxID=5499 RepID=A0A9Q8LIE4_PASFU|nr:uncharacterized protein CLAFUR5_06227 [Fulvia fulva]UJO18065.1 hypothetical protein CLAFUR5_06227 [Fulvia fulva]WPV15186.1 hypothetical protein CLAFUW4_06083 [Fulvia fulva]
MKTPSILTLACAATAAAQSATVVIEASHGGAGQGLANTTITVPLNQRYTDSALDTVSNLYLTGADGVPLDSITCTPHRNGNLTGAGGLPFTSTQPSSLSTNTVQVGSLFCNSTDSSTSSSSSASSASTTSTASSTQTVPGVLPPVVTDSTTRGANATSILLTTVSGSQSTASPSTITSTAIVSGSDGPQTSVFTSVVNGEATATASGPPSLNTDSQGAATAIGSGDRSVLGAAVFLLGLMALL